MGRRIRSRKRVAFKNFLGALIIACATLGAFALSRTDLARAAAPSAAYRVIDGDTFENSTTSERIRLANIDTPETHERAQCVAERQAGERATQAARRLLAETHSVNINRVGRTDRYGRTIAYVRLDGRDMGEALIAMGLARPWRGRREPWCGPRGALLR